MCHGHVHYEMESNHIQIVTRGEGSLELVLEEKKREGLTFSHFLAYLVEPYMIVSVEVLGLDR